MDKADLYKHYYAEFQKLAKKFKGQRWFTRNWRISMNFNNSGQPVFTLMKSNWFNDISHGIHFESWVTGADIDRNTVPVSFHFEAAHEKTGVQRGAFYKYLLEHGEGIISQLDDYTLSPKSFQLLIKRCPFSDNDFLDTMESEYTRLRPLAPVVDDAIKAVRE